MTLFESLAGTRCMDRWDEGSLDTDPHRHGRFTAIVDRRENGLNRTDLTDVLFTILTIQLFSTGYDDVHTHQALF